MSKENVVRDGGSWLCPNCGVTISFDMIREVSYAKEHFPQKVTRKHAISPTNELEIDMVCTNCTKYFIWKIIPKETSHFFTL